MNRVNLKCPGCGNTGGFKVWLDDDPQNAACRECDRFGDMVEFAPGYVIPEYNPNKVRTG